MNRRLVWICPLLMTVTTTIAPVLVAGCGDDSSVTQHDAAIDSPPPPPIDAPPPPVGHYYYVVDKVTVPTTSTQARATALDLNGDATVDNQLGMVLATFSGMGLETQPSQDKAIDTGAELMLADLYATDLTTSAGATFTLYKGSNPMPAACANAQDMTCRHHLTGSASFTALAMPIDTPLAGNLVGGALAAGPGHLSLQMVFPNAAPVVVPLVGARVKIGSASALALDTMILAGGISAADVDSKVVPAMQVGFMSLVTRDCTMLTSPPGCGCAQDSSGKSVLSLFDANHDCAISIDEVRNNSLIMSLLAPDVMLEGQMCLSIGVGAHAVPAGFIAPQ